MPNEINQMKQIADRYATFAAGEARGSSEIYERLAQAVAGSPDVLEFLATLPAESASPTSFGEGELVQKSAAHGGNVAAAAGVPVKMLAARS
jgi:L-asparaginase II